MAKRKKNAKQPAAKAKTPPLAAAARTRPKRDRTAAAVAKPRASASAPAGDLPLTIVGVGASAGGLEAFSQLLRTLPDNANLCIIFVQHLSPSHDSILSTLLGDTTLMPVKQVTDGVELEPNHVYVIPPNQQLEIRDRRLYLSVRPSDRGTFMPVDLFFRSLAEYAQERAVGVVLSGTNSDGAAGLREIKAAGGLTFAQDPASAKYDGMPRAAIATGSVDRALSPEMIATELVRIARDPRHAAMIRSPDGEPEAVNEDAMHGIFALLRQVSGVDFTLYKQPTVRRRMQRRMVLHKMPTIEDYFRFIQQHPEETGALYQDILIHVTRFFREPESFETLRDRIFPQIIKSRAHQQPIRVWVPGCATGEEGYSIAMALLEFLGDDANNVPIQLFATDVSERAVEQARAGVYPESISADVSAERLRRFFIKVDHSYRIAKRVRDVCVFAKQDLTRDPPFSKLDLIVCRNVLIYLGPVLQKRLMTVFHYALKPSGFLVLGGSESIGPHAELFAQADKRHKIYVKKSGVVRSNMDFPGGNYGMTRQENTRKPPPDPRAGSHVQNEANRVILARFAPPGVIVNEDLQIIQFRGQTGAFLEPSPGEASLNLLKMARDGLLYDLRTAVHESRKSGSPVKRDGLHVRYNGQILNVTLEVVPLVVSGDERHFLILFEEKTPAQPPLKKVDRRRKSDKNPGKSARKTGASAERLDRLQQELAASREYLQSIIQDLEASNEELQSANEEILSSNEELQSTNEELDTAKEELQSTNEELNTLNEELQSRNEELSRVNSDLINLLGSVQIAIVMVAGDLRIRRFTPMAEKVLNLIPSDLGRPISDIKPNIDCPDLEQLIAESVDHIRVIERQVKDRHGRALLMRIRPYKNVENRIDGAVVALFDLESHHGTASEPAELAGILQDLREPVLVLDAELRVRAASDGFNRMSALVSDEMIGRSIYAIGDGRWDLPEMHELLEHVLPRDGAVQSSRLHVETASGRQKLQVDARRIGQRDGNAGMIVVHLHGADGSGRNA